MPRKPNVLVILIDDMGFKDLACYGSTFYETPNIDRLSEDGALFTNAYAACPVCSPSRASLLTGKYPARIGVTDWIGAHAKGKLIDAPYIDHLPLEEDNIAKVMKRNGYKTYHVGKWHLGDAEYHPQHQGFDVNIAGCHIGMPWNGYFSPYKIENLEDEPDGEYLTDRITDEAISLIESNGDQPFFLYLSHYAVHTPIQAKEQDLKRFVKKAERLGLDKKDPFVIGEYYPCEHKKNEHVTRRMFQSDVAYAAMIYNLDYNIGRVIEKLKEMKIYEETIIVFTSDNGGLATSEGSPTCNFPAAEGKGWVYDGGIREPLLIIYKNQIEGSRLVHTPVTTPDIFPTILDLCNIQDAVTGKIDGISMLPLLQGETELPREGIFWHYPHYGNQGGTPAAAVRSGDFKLIRFFEDEHLELYNLADDISETRNITDDDPEMTVKLKEMLNRWLTEVNGIIPERNGE
ncbi:MAG: sulfatase [Saccharofermentanales bacterium]